MNSTFAWFPGIPIFHSRDLVHWTQIGNAIDRPTQLDLAKTNMGLGLYAPDISFHDGTFYILNTCVGCGGNFVITAKRPQGPWSDPVWLPDVNGIDTSLFFDDDGSAWIVHNGPPPEKPKYDGHTALWLQQFDPKTLKTFGRPEVLVDQGTHPEAESDLDRGTAHLQEGRLLLSDRGRGRHRGTAFRSSLSKRQGGRAL